MSMTNYNAAKPLIAALNSSSIMLELALHDLEISVRHLPSLAEGQIAEMRPLSTKDQTSRWRRTPRSLNGWKKR
jgi:hypothetical protein